MAELNLYSPVTALSGIGPGYGKKLEKLGIRNLYDLIAFFPRAYEDRTKFVTVCDITVDEPACFQATVISHPRTSHIRKGLTITKVTVSDMTARLNLVFFNQPYVQDQLHYGEDYIFYGTLREDYGHQIQNPQFESASKSGTNTGRILPIYPLTNGLSNKVISRSVQQALDACLDTLPEILPQEVMSQYELPDAATAYKTIHAPESFEALTQAKRRLIFDEFFIFSAGLHMMRSKRTAISCKPWREMNLEPYLAALPYKLTSAQKRTLADIQSDLTSSTPMNRLIQGDVGSGKTALAAASAFWANQNSCQAAFLAPTEILAEQHYASLSKLLGTLDMEVVLLTGSMSQSEKKWVKDRVKNGHVDLVIGTHALLTDDLQFCDLGLVITDEQHRFGVEQRSVLYEKGQHPHMLFLSATPIPRTLSLILYGDLDVSVMDELPPGRKPIETFHVRQRLRDRVNAFMKKQVVAGNQVYVVCPAVEENEETGLRSAEQWANYLQTEVFPDLTVGLVHGRMKAADKDAIMRRFSANEVSILVSTTVIEVGVDVPNATLMVIENAERFGLSQMHQLRGRVGRGQDQSYCILISDATSPEAMSRFKSLCDTNDGFQIAEDDLAQRGPGDLFGDRQHGLPQFKVASLVTDTQTLHQAQEATVRLNWELLQRDPVYKPLLERIHALFSDHNIGFN